MELVFRKDISRENNSHDLYVELNNDGTVKVIVRSKNGTGESGFTISTADFDRLCEIRAMVRNISIEKAK